MIATTNYISDNIRLIKSMIVHSRDSAVQINNELVMKYGTSILGGDPRNKNTWKYYKNISGEYHDLNSLINITLIEDGSVKKLTIELLKENQVTLRELLKFDTFYDNLIDSYPDDELLIKGIIYAIDKEETIESKDGVILAFSPAYVEEQETTLIHKLNEFSIGYFYRWNISDYALIDNLYNPTLLATLYTKLVLKAINIRADLLFTSETHSFHVDSFFRSNYGINVDIKILSKETQFWLYKNMKYIRKHIGNNKLLDIILQKILTENHIGVAKVNMISVLPELDLFNQHNPSKPSYDKKVNRFISEPVNEHYILDDSDDLSSKSLLLKQFTDKFVDNDMVIKDTSAYDNTLDTKLKSNVLHTQLTKTFKVKIDKNFVVTEKVSLKLILDTFFKLSFDNTYKNTLNFVDPNTGYSYDMDCKQAALTVIKLLAKIAGSDNPKVSTYIYTSLLNHDITVDELNHDLIHSDYYEDYAERLIKSRPMLETIIETEDMHKYINSINVYDSLIWNLATNTNDMMLNSAVKVMNTRLHKTGKIFFNDGMSTIDELLSNQFVDLYFDEKYDCIKTLDVILYGFTGFYYSKSTIGEDLDKFIKIVKTLSSDTIQFMNTYDNNDRLSLRYNSLMSNTTPGLASIQTAVFRALEDFYGDLVGMDIPYGCFLDAEPEVSSINGHIRMDPPKLMLYNYNALFRKDKIYADNINSVLIGTFNSYLDLFKPDIGAKLNDMKDNLKMAMNDYGYITLITKRSVEVMMEWVDPSLRQEMHFNVIGQVGKYGVDLYKPRTIGGSFNVNEALHNPFTDVSLTGRTNSVNTGIGYIVDYKQLESVSTNVIFNVGKDIIDMSKPPIFARNVAINNSVEVLRTELTVNGSRTKSESNVVMSGMTTEEIIASLTPEVVMEHTSEIDNLDVTTMDESNIKDTALHNTNNETIFFVNNDGNIDSTPALVGKI